MSLATKHILTNVGYVLAFIKTWAISFVSESSDTKQDSNYFQISKAFILTSEGPGGWTGHNDSVNQKGGTQLLGG